MSTSQLFVIAIFLFGSSLHGLSQRLVEDGKQWNIAVYPTFSPNTTSSSLRIQGDTTIDNVTYKRLMLSRDSLLGISQSI